MKKRFCFLITVSFVLVLLLVGVTVSGQAAPEATVEVNASFMYKEARSMLDLINEFRTGKDAYYLDKDNTTTVKVTGLKKLKYDYNLEKVAMLRALELAVHFSHTRPNGQAWSSAHSGSYTRGENIAYGFGSAKAAFNAFREDNKNYAGQGHRRIMLESKFTRVGIGCVKVGNALYWAQEFGSGKAGGSASDKFSSKTVEATWKTLKAGRTKVATSAEELKVAVGKSVSLPKVLLTSTTGAKNSLGKAKWSSSNSKIVKISNNKLVAVKKGKTEIKITVGDTTLKVKVQVVAASDKSDEKTETIDDYNVPLGLEEYEVFFLDDEEVGFWEGDETLEEGE